MSVCAKPGIRYRREVHRFIALLLLVAALAPVTWIRSPLPPRTKELALRITRVPLGDSARRADSLGAFRLERAWQLESRYNAFGGYSSLLNLGNGRLLALSDNGSTLRFSAPGSTNPEPPQKSMPLKGNPLGYSRDVESATADLASGTVWAGMESENAILRYSLKRGKLIFLDSNRPKGMTDWGVNSGPESLVRLMDGQFLTLREGFVSLTDRRRHPAIRFRGDPIQQPDGEEFVMAGPPNFRPTDALQLPDGRVLVLFRKVLWPLPARFAGAIAIGDPAAIGPGQEWKLQTVAMWGSDLPSDNFEAMAIEQIKGMRLALWMMSDDNRAAFQRTLLLKMTFDPADLPQ